MQLALGRLGLASLDHAEAHVLASLDAVLANLCLLHGQAPDAPELLQTIGEFDEGPARLERNTDLLFGARRPGRRARIMVTLPDDAADNPSLLQSLLQEGMDCARINCAYGDRKLRNGDRLRLRDARGSGRKWRIAERNPEGCWAESRKTTYLANGTVLHLQRGDDQPDLSTTLASLPPQESRMTIRTGDTVRLTYGAEPGKPAVHDLAGRLLRPGTVPVDVAEVFRDARAGEPIRFDDGRIVGVIEEADGNTLQVRVLHTRRPVERMSSGKGINLPATRLALPALSDEDLRDLEFVARNADIIGLSFTNDAADVRFLNERLRHLGNQEVGVIFKIETDRGCANLPGILIEAMKFPNFGVMVARGDLAAECGFERLAELQDDILRLCESAHVPVVWATGVLESLARSGHPARAEITDAAAAQRAECVMLGKGRYIADAVRTLDGLLGRMLTRDYKHQRLLGRLRFTPGGGGGRSPANPSTRCPPTST
jgi:pyruvate kinase